MSLVRLVCCFFFFFFEVPNFLILVVFSMKQNFHSIFEAATSRPKFEGVRNCFSCLSKAKEGLPRFCHVGAEASVCVCVSC